MTRSTRATVKEYIRDELTCYYKGMSVDMGRKFGFVNIAGGSAYHNVTTTAVLTDYEADSKAAV